MLFWWDPVIATHRLVPSLLLIAFAVLGTEMLRRQVIREFPDRVTTGSPAGIAQGIAERMREAASGASRPPARPPRRGGDPRVAELERLAGLRDSGALSEEEFAAEKARILGPPRRLKGQAEAPAGAGVTAADALAIRAPRPR